MIQPHFVRGGLTIDRPFGYIPDGPLYGWDEPRRNLNSPVWNFQPFVMPWHYVNHRHPWRTFFHSHGWVEYITVNHWRVIDICHGLYVPGGQDTISDGSQTSLQYMRAARDPEGFLVATFLPMLISRMCSTSAVRTVTNTALPGLAGVFSIV